MFSDGSKRPNSQRGQCGGNRTIRQEIVRRAGYAPDFCHNAGAQGVPRTDIGAGSKDSQPDLEWISTRWSRPFQTVLIEEEFPKATSSQNQHQYLGSFSDLGLKTVSLPLRSLPNFHP